MVVLSRLLSPADFGIIALLMSFSGISSVIVDCGFSQAIIRDKNVTALKLSSVFVLNLFVAVMIYIALYAFTPAICNFFNFSHHLLVVRMFFLVIIFEAISLIPTTVLTKEMNFSWLAASQNIATIVTGVVAICMAFLGMGLWSLVVNTALYSLLRAVLLWLKCNCFFSCRFSFHALTDYFSFSSNLLLAAVIDQSVTNIESLVIGKNYSKADLGFYSRAKEINSLSSSTIIALIVKVTYPAMAQIRDDTKKFSEVYTRIIGVTLFCNTIVSSFLLVSASDIVLFLWGDAWAATAVFLIPWCVYSIFFPFRAISINIFQAYGKTRRHLCISVLYQVVRVITIIIFVRKSIIVFTYAIVLSNLLATILLSYFAMPIINSSLAQLIINSRKTLFAALTSISVVLLMQYMLNISSPFVMICVKGLMGVAIFGGMSLYMHNPYISEVLSVGSIVFKKLISKA